MLGRKLFELKTLGNKYAYLPNSLFGEFNPLPTKMASNPSFFKDYSVTSFPYYFP